ncbi:MAG: hypothetical protein WEA99_09200 [Brumimicrobium sp.]
MEKKDETMVAFYQVLGRLFYAAAQADKVIRPEEVQAMKQMVKEEWLDVEDTFDDFNSDSAYQIEIVFDYLLSNDVVVENVIGELKEFKKIHSSLFTDEMNTLILTTTNKIASAFAQKNKSELVFLSQLQIVLSQ